MIAHWPCASQLELSKTTTYVALPDGSLFRLTPMYIRYSDNYG